VAVEFDAKRQGRIVLVADDSRTIREMIVFFLKKAGYTVFAAENGRELLSLLNRIQPRVIVLDAEMPEMDGYETCARIRQTHPDLKAPVIFFTSQNSTESLFKAKGAKADDYIVKPFNPEGLVERVDRWAIRNSLHQPTV